MKLNLDLDLEGLEEALKRWLPKGIKPQSLSLDGNRMRLEAKAPLIGTMKLVAHVASGPGFLTFSRFDLEGVGLMKGMALGKIKEALAELDRRSGPFRVWGESDGERVQVRWDA